MKELDQIVLQKGFFASTKGHLHNPEGQVEVESPQIGSFFLVNFIYINKFFFFSKMALLPKHPIPGHFIFLK